jgi:hypothetical protein
VCLCGAGTPAREVFAGATVLAQHIRALGLNRFEF